MFGLEMRAEGNLVTILRVEYYIVALKCSYHGQINLSTLLSSATTCLDLFMVPKLSCQLC